MVPAGSTKRTVHGLLDRVRSKLRLGRYESLLIDVHQVFAHATSIYARIVIYPVPAMEDGSLSPDTGS